MSALMAELCKLLKVRELTTTSQANGSIEKLNMTQKEIGIRFLRTPQMRCAVTFCVFAYRQVLYETTVLSPFELLYGRHVKRPFAIFKKEWEEPLKELSSVLSYILGSHERMQHIRYFVKESEIDGKKNQEAYYGGKARTRTVRKY